MSVQLQRRLFTVKEYHLMSETGILSETDRVELIEGEIIQMAAIGARHATAVRRLNRLFHRLPENRVIVDVQNPVQLSERTEPQLIKHPSSIWIIRSATSRIRLS